MTNSFSALRQAGEVQETLQNRLGPQEELAQEWWKFSLQ